MGYPVPEVSKYCIEFVSIYRYVFEEWEGAEVVETCRWKGDAKIAGESASARIRELADRSLGIQPLTEDWKRLFQTLGLLVCEREIVPKLVVDRHVILSAVCPDPWPPIARHVA